MSRELEHGPWNEDEANALAERYAPSRDYYDGDGEQCARIQEMIVNPRYPQGYWRKFFQEQKEKECAL